MIKLWSSWNLTTYKQTWLYSPHQFLDFFLSLFVFKGIYTYWLLFWLVKKKKLGFVFCIKIHHLRDVKVSNTCGEMNIVFSDKLLISFLWKDISENNNLKFLFHHYGKWQSGESHFSIEDSHLSMESWDISVFSQNSSEHKNQRTSEKSWSSAFPLSEGDLSEKQRERGNDRGKAVFISVMLTEVARALFYV